MRHTVELNIKVDQPSPNGHLYPKAVFIKAMNEWLNGGNPYISAHSLSPGSLTTPIDSIGAKCEGYTIADDGTITLDIDTMITPGGKLLDTAIGAVGKRLSPVSSGTVNRKDKTVNDDLMIITFHPDMNP